MSPGIPSGKSRVDVFLYTIEDFFSWYTIEDFFSWHVEAPFRWGASLRSLIGLRYASTSTKVVRFGISLSFLAPM